MQEKDVIIEAHNLSVHFPVKGSLPFNRKFVKAVSDVSLEIRRGETFGLVGESGCGKSTFANALLGMIKPTDGKVIFEGKDLNALPRKEFKELRRGMVGCESHGSSLVPAPHPHGIKVSIAYQM